MYGAADAATKVANNAPTTTSKLSSAKRAASVPRRAIAMRPLTETLDTANLVEVVRPRVVAAGAAVEDVARRVVATERVVAGTSEHRVVPGSAFDRVVAGSAEEDVVAIQARDLVVSAQCADHVAAGRTEQDVRTVRPRDRARGGVALAAACAQSDDRSEHEQAFHARSSRTSPVRTPRRPASPAASSTTTFAPRRPAARHGRNRSATPSTRRSRSRKTASIAKRMKNVCTDPAGRRRTPSSAGSCDFPSNPRIRLNGVSATRQRSQTTSPFDRTRAFVDAGISTP